MKRRSLIKQLKYLPLFVLFFFVGSCGEAQTSQIRHAKLGQTDLYIPSEYLKFRHTSIGPEAILIQAWYPGSAIVPSNDINDLFKQGLWWKQVRVLLLLRRDANIDFDESSKKSTKHLHATALVGDEGGLMHYTQPPGAVQDLYDLWLEYNPEGKIISRTTCSEKIIKLDRPQCEMTLLFNKDISLGIAFDKKLLPEWKTIKNN